MCFIQLWVRIWYFDNDSRSNIFHKIAWEEQTQSLFVQSDPVFTGKAFNDDKMFLIFPLHPSLLAKVLCHLVVSQALEEESQARSLKILTSKSIPQLYCVCPVNVYQNHLCHPTSLPAQLLCWDPCGLPELAHMWVSQFFLCSTAKHVKLSLIECDKIQSVFQINGMDEITLGQGGED